MMLLLPLPPLLLLLHTPATAGSSTPPTRPNVLMLAADDLRPLFGEAFGYPEVLTPNFDNFFLGRGLVFRSSYVQVAVCGPSRSSLLTGRRPDSSRINAALNTWCWWAMLCSDGCCLWSMLCCGWWVDAMRQRDDRAVAAP
jgi:hypothetical protein